MNCLKKAFALETMSFQMPFRSLDHEEFEKIKQKASTMWREEHENRLRNITTYSAEYRKKQLDEPTQNLIRLHSPTRLHKPHPPEIFLVTRLHKIPRHHNNSKSTITLSSQDKWEEVLRQSPGWCKSNLLPQALLKTSRSRGTLLNNSNAVRVAEGWPKLANEKDHQTVKKKIDCITSASADMTRKDAPRQRYISQVLPRSIKPECIPSLNHWLQKATKQETKEVEQLLRTLSSSNPQKVQVQDPRFQLANRACVCEMTSKPYVYDYQIHPEWVTQPWHTGYRQNQT
ncbi:uncharacterized protein LOC132391596 [Hypanus sabinus]|uniref:uncharacterized protein LOC132391596 n=1 Tax=Hypanus sabinus TaxID=79690 RepID=UPI0028C37B95|nr:uncharacterized protein LOC132391596 [Hypanus sabinus]